MTPHELVLLARAQVAVAITLTMGPTLANLPWFVVASFVVYMNVTALAFLLRFALSRASRPRGRWWWNDLDWIGALAAGAFRFWNGSDYSTTVATFFVALALLTLSQLPDEGDAETDTTKA
jgi:hypothetical protein